MSMSPGFNPDSVGRLLLPRRSSIFIARRVLVSALLLLATLAPAPAHAQSPSGDDDTELRIGITAGGIGLVGLSLELRRGDRSIDTNLATFGFKDVSLAVTAKQYFGGGDLQPFLGIGLWGVAASADDPTQRSGRVLLLRVPVGADWRLSGDHFLGGSLALNEGLWIRRGDPLDDTPISHRPIPLPGFYYRVRP